MTYIEKRKLYYPLNAEIIERKDIGLFIAQYDHLKGKALVIFEGRKSKPSVYFAYPNEDRRKYALDNFVKKAEENANRYNGNNLEVGDILVYSWGYEQTNIDFFKVVRKTEKSVAIVEIGKNAIGSRGFMSNDVEPNPEIEKGKPVTRRVNNDFVSMRFGIAKKWNGEPVNETSYA